MVSPSNWPEELALAVSHVYPIKDGYKVQLSDKARAIDMLSKIKGHYKAEDEQKNPLEEALSSIPREELLIIREHLNQLSKLEKTKPDDIDGNA